MGLLGLLPTVLKTIGRVAGIDIFSKAADSLTSLSLPPEKQAELQAALLAHEAQMKQLSIDEMRTAMSESIAMVQSDDKFTKRARPTGLYIFYGVSAVIAVGMLFGVHVDSTAILTILAPLAGVGGTYVLARTKEKLAGNGT